MRYKFVAPDIVVLRLSDKPDASGDTIPTTAQILFPVTLPVTYGPDIAEKGAVIGHARLRKVGNDIMADMTLFSVMKDTARSLELMRKLTPAVSFNVLKCRPDIRTFDCIAVCEVFLTPHGNDDVTIPPLGENIHAKRPPKDLH